MNGASSGLRRRRGGAIGRGRAVALLAAWLLLPVACGASKPTGDGGSGGSSGSGGQSGNASGGQSGSGSGGSSGSGGFSFDAGGFDINLNDVSLGDLKLDLNVQTCPSDVKTGDACAMDSALCTTGAKVCVCAQSKWTCFGN